MALTFHSVASLSLASNFFLSSTSALDGASASLASEDGVVSPSFFSADSALSLYHLDLGDRATTLNGAGANWDLKIGVCAANLELERRALVDVETACLNIVILVVRRGLGR